MNLYTVRVLRAESRRAGQQHELQVRGDSGTQQWLVFIDGKILSSAVICLEVDRYAYRKCQCVTAPL